LKHIKFQFTQLHLYAFCLLMGGTSGIVVIQMFADGSEQDLSNCLPVIETKICYYSYEMPSVKVHTLVCKCVN